MNRVLVALLFLAAPTFAQERTVYSKALETLDSQDLKQMTPERLQDSIHRDLVLWTIDVAKSTRVRIDSGASVRLDQLYIDASKKVAESPEGSRQRQLFPANSVRVISRLCSYAEPQPRGGGLITLQSVKNLLSDLEKRLEGFCPCFPFC